MREDPTSDSEPEKGGVSADPQGHGLTHCMALTKNEPVTMAQVQAPMNTSRPTRS